MNEQRSESITRRPREVEVTILSATGLLILQLINYTLAMIWFTIFFIIFFVWYTIGLPPTSKDDHTTINVKCKYRIQELKVDLSKVEFEIIALVLLVRPILILVEYYFPSAETPWTMNPFTVLIIGPLLEEFYHRGILQERLSWIVSDKCAILLTSVFFAFTHWMPGLPFDIAFIMRFSSGLFFGIVYSKTRNIMVSYIAHIGVNLWAFLPLIL